MEFACFADRTSLMILSCLADLYVCRPELCDFKNELLSIEEFKLSYGLCIAFTFRINTVGSRILYSAFSEMSQLKILHIPLVDEL